MEKQFIRKSYYDPIFASLKENNSLIQVISGPRQVGKTTLALQIKDKWPGSSFYEAADQPAIPMAEWIETHWNTARNASKNGHSPLLILDEVQKIPGWSETVKKLVDEDKRQNFHVKIMLLGSSALLVQRGLTESLSGRFELNRVPHWSYCECHECFGVTLEEFFTFGGYPGAIPLHKDYARWGRFVRDSLIETIIGKDVLLMSPVQKPALLRQTMGIACAHPAQILSYQKITGQLSDAGNTTTIAHYLNLLSAAYMLAVLPRWSGAKIRQRGSIPKIVLRDNSLANAMTLPSGGEDLHEPKWRGRLVENAVGATLVALAERYGAELFYWRERNDEVDYIWKFGRKLLAIEVKSGLADKASGLHAFMKKNPAATPLVIGASKTSQFPAAGLAEFFENPEQFLGLKS